MTDTASPAGALSIDVTLRDGVVTAVEVASSRPVDLADRLLAGRPAAAAVALVPRLYSLCGRAQGSAAELALKAARTEPGSGAEGGIGSAEDRARARRIEIETAQEYLWRALLDWPQTLGEAPQAAPLAALRPLLENDPAAATHETQQALREMVQTYVLGGDAAEWYRRAHLPSFEIWIAQAATPAARLLAAVQRDGAQHGAPPNPAQVPLLPSLSDWNIAREISVALLGDAHFAARPQRAGMPAETGAIARLRMHPLIDALYASFGRSTLTRLAARITELARIAAGLPAPAPLFGWRALPAGSHLRRGLGWVESARGLLLHLVDIDGPVRNERIVRYRTLAPTEWNFHPQGALVAGLVGAHVGSAAELQRRAQWLVHALDPCVVHTLQVRTENTQAEAGRVHA